MKWNANKLSFKDNRFDRLIISEMNKEKKEREQDRERNDIVRLVLYNLNTNKLN